jgi:hypothetical protein
MLSLRKFFIGSAILCAMIITSGAQGEHASARTSSGASASGPVILCMPGFVLRCNSHGCFCVKP